MDGEYSKLEKDFLGNERMVHYNAAGVAVSASKVERAADGSMTVGEPVPLTPQPQPVAAVNLDQPREKTYPPGTVATIGIASFVIAALGALYILNSNKPTSAAERFNTAVYREPIQQVQPPSENLERVPGPQELDPPQPRQEDESPPGERTRPRINLREDEPEAKPEPPKEEPESKPEPAKGPDPIDLRGEGDESR